MSFLQFAPGAAATTATTGASDKPATPVSDRIPQPANTTPTLPAYQLSEQQSIGLESAINAANAALNYSVHLEVLDRQIAGMEYTLYNEIDGLADQRKYIELGVKGEGKNEDERKYNKVERLKTHQGYQALMSRITQMEWELKNLKITRARIGRDYYVFTGVAGRGLEAGKFVE